MRIILARPRGFCSGVKRAISILDDLLKQSDRPVYVYHQIVHNTQVVESFQRRGVMFVESLEDVPQGAFVLFSAHGVSPALRQQAEAAQLIAVDATCPLVEHLHHQVRSLIGQGFHLILIGHPGHDEVIGTLGEAPPERITLVSSLDDVKRLEYTEDQKLTALVQTTFLSTQAQEIVTGIAERFPWFISPPRFGVCHVTQERQNAIRNYNDHCDIVLVIGSENSSNSRRLLETAQKAGYPAHLIDQADDIDLHWFHEKNDIFLTAGASAPEETVQHCIARLAEHFHVEVHEQSSQEDDELPPKMDS